VQSLRKPDYSADGEWNVSGVALIVILPRQTVLLTEVVIYVAVDLVGVELAGRAFHKGVKGLIPALRVGGVRSWNDVLPACLCLQDGKRNPIDLTGRNAGGPVAAGAVVIGIGEVRKGCRIAAHCVRQAGKSWHTVESAAEGVADPLSLVGSEKEHLISLDGPADCSSINIAVQRRRTGEEWISGQESRRSIEPIILKILVHLTVKSIGTGLGCGFDMRASSRPHGGVVHRRTHVDFLNGFDRRSRQRFTNGIEYGAVGLDLAANSENFAGVERESAVCDVAGRVPVEQVVRIHAIEGEQVAGVALAVGYDALIPQTFVRSRSRKEIRTHSWRQDRELGEASRTQRDRLDLIST
jgi:hypothetical protein